MKYVEVDRSRVVAIRVTSIMRSEEVHDREEIDSFIYNLYVITDK